MNNPLIIALDLETSEQARALVAALGDSVSFYKVGLELYASAGMEFVRELKGQGHRVFLDLKLYDIGETVKRAAAQIAKAQVDFLTVHARRQVMESAVAGRGDSNLKILAVTVLTSVDDDDLRADGHTRPASELVDLRVTNAMEVGADGIVSSALEVARVRRLAPRTTLVVPGVRSPGVGTNDQKRVATPADAVVNGADFLVIGRQVTRAKDPQAEVKKILDELSVVA
jgi:orotidine-5'-phosphate decarboxylase